MMPAIKSEFRKLITVRSTYVILGFSLLLELFFALYATGYKADVADLHSHTMLASEVTSAISALAVFGSVAAVLLVTHEYRYNTIMYTLTAAKRRTNVWLAKIFIISVFAIVFSLVVGLLSPWLANVGVHLHGHTLVSQNLPLRNLLMRAVFYGWGYSMLALIVAMLIRIQVGSMAALFLIPTTVENLLGLLLKNNQVYLPFSALSAVVEKGHISYSHAALVALAYIVGGWIIAGIFFIRRDAN